MAIRFTRELREDIDSVVRRFNSKVNRLNKLNKELVPDKIEFQDFLQFTRRKDLMRRLKDLNEFTKRGAEEVVTLDSGVKIQQWEMNVLKRNLTSAKRVATRNVREYGEITPTSLGIRQDYSYREMGDDRYIKLKGRRKALEKDISKLSKQELRNLRGLIDTLLQEDGRQRVFRESYYKMLFDIGNTVGIDSDIMYDIEHKLEGISYNEFYKMFTEEKAFQVLIDYYISVSKLKTDPISVREDVLTLYEGLNSYLESKMNE